MIYLYPANKMENLLVLLDKIQQINPLPVFTPELIIVQNAGMHHWLNMSLAKQRGISMNTEFALPAQFLWKLLRDLVATEDDINQSPFSREVLSWRIFELLNSKEVIEDADFSQVNQYLRNHDNQSEQKSAQQAELKRYQLACQLADLYEQYLIFRPEWIDKWHQQNFDCADAESTSFNVNYRWQGKLWAKLVAEQSYNPIALIEQAKVNMTTNQQLLPKRISFFGINALAPMWLDFINALSQYTQVHFFHLNPCFDYWGDIVSEKQAMRLVDKWLDNIDDEHHEIGNPLLANLAQQGREFLSLLQQFSVINIDAFESLDESDYKADSISILQSIQQDILTLSDKRKTPITLADDSIIFASCHSALREVQTLHDWLLHQFNQDGELTPKDILVMCPQIEDYAPYINAVFSRGWQDIDDKIPPLPCSIADRSSKNTEPLISAFLDLLQLPDSRFQVSTLMALLRLPATQAKFDINYESLDKISFWLQQACIHWGIDQNHKANILNNENVSGQFTWQQGLSRLLRGFAFQDREAIFQHQALLPYIEGEDAQLLGQLMLLLEQLQFAASELNKKRTSLQWQDYLHKLLTDLFINETESENTLAIATIQQAIAYLVEYCNDAKYSDVIDLKVVKSFLDNHFSQPDARRQFMVGQVTFCSMIPMRSIPFKVIAILGLNEGQYPRQRQPVGFDLLNMSKAELGDRSRRGDDRYLFLEAIISARKNLYLSYQGRNIKNNKEQQASLVLKELMDYLHIGYGWQFEGDNSLIHQHAMQPFSPRNFQSELPSFDHHWLRFCQEDSEYRESLVNHIEPLKSEFDCEQVDRIAINNNQLIRFYQHPSRYFAEARLSLNLLQYDYQLEDAEPFDIDALASYQLKQDLIADALSQADKSDLKLSQQQLLIQAKLSGKFPELPTMEQTFNSWSEESITLANVIKDHCPDEIERVNCAIKLPIKHSGKEIVIEFGTELAIANQQLIAYRNTTAKAKDLFALYLNQLIVQYWQANQLLIDKVVTENLTEQQLTSLQSVKQSIGFYFDTKAQKITSFQYKELPNIEEHLKYLVEQFLIGQEQPKLLNGELAHKRFTARKFEQPEFEKFWLDTNSFSPFGLEPYIRYFWPQCPQLTDIEPALAQIYQPVYENVVKNILAVEEL